MSATDCISIAGLGNTGADFATLAASTGNKVATSGLSLQR